MRAFLPYMVVQSIPFSSNKFHEILNKFSISPGSIQANTMKETVRDCERASMEGEDRFCATSLKSFIDFVVLKLGKNIQLLGNEVRKEAKNPLFEIGNGVKNMGEKEVVCHSLQYPHAVFLCHSIDRTLVYKVPLLGLGGTKMANALAVCHKDTSAWSPNHVSFKILNVKPGTVPVCHFLAGDTLVWVSK